jgi:hypothetical protein
MSRNRYNPTPDYSPNQLIQTVGYQPQSDPALQQMLAKNLENMQQRYDFTTAAIAEKEGEIGELFPYDDEYKQQVLSGFKGKLDDIAKQYGYDYGAASNKIARAIGEERGNKAYALAKEKIRQVDAAQKMKMQLGPNAIVLNDPMNVSLSNDTRMEDLTTNIIQAPDYQRVIREAADGLEADIRALGLSEHPKFNALLEYGKIADNNKKIDALINDPAFHELIKIKAGTMDVDNRQSVGYDPETGTNIFTRPDDFKNYISAALSPLRMKREDRSYMQNPDAKVGSGEDVPPFNTPPLPNLKKTGSTPSGTPKTNYEEARKTLGHLSHKINISGKYTPEEKAAYRELLNEYAGVRKSYLQSDAGKAAMRNIPSFTEESFIFKTTSGERGLDDVNNLFQGVSDDKKREGMALINSEVRRLAINHPVPGDKAYASELFQVINSNPDKFNTESLKRPVHRTAFFNQVLKPLESKTEEWQSQVDKGINENYGKASGDINVGVYTPAHDDNGAFTRLTKTISTHISKLIDIDEKIGKQDVKAQGFLSKEGDIVSIKIKTSTREPLTFVVEKRFPGRMNVDSKNLRLTMGDTESLEFAKDLALQENTPEIFSNQAAYVLDKNFKSAPSIENKFGYAQKYEFKVGGKKIKSELRKLSDSFGDKSLSFMDDEVFASTFKVDGVDYYGILINTEDSEDREQNEFVFNNPIDMMDWIYSSATSYAQMNNNMGLASEFNNRRVPEVIKTYQKSKFATPKQKQEYYR